LGFTLIQKNRLNDRRLFFDLEKLMITNEGTDEELTPEEQKKLIDYGTSNTL
jgi:hypothetical protein